MTDHFANLVDQDFQDKCDIDEHGMTEREARRLAREEERIEEFDRERQGIYD